MGAPIDPGAAAELSGPPLDREEALARVRAVIDEKALADEFLGVVLLAAGDQVVLHEARGLAKQGIRGPQRGRHALQPGIDQQAFTRVAVGQLAEKGRLALDDAIEKFLPTYPNREAAAKVTVRHLLDMTSGIGDFFGRKYEDTPEERVRSLENYLQFFASEPFRFAPGSQRRYSNGGYIVLGLIVAKASGQSYFGYVHDHIYVPAGMTATGHVESDVPEANVASGYTRNWDDAEHGTEPRRSDIYTRPARGSSAGGGYATAMDLSIVRHGAADGKLLGPLGKEWFSGPQAYAGGAPGINAELDMDPVPGWTLVVMGNYDPPAAGALAQKRSARC